MSLPRYRLIAVLVMALLCVMASLGGTETKTEVQRPTLAGLPGGIVRVVHLDKEFEDKGVTEDRVLSDVEVRLRKAGIKVFTSMDDPKWESSGRPVLYTQMMMVRNGNCRAQRTDIWLSQQATLTRNSARVMATTWDVGVTGSGSVFDSRDSRNALGDLVDYFINDYLAVNPK
jgi:hypothetical protein